jgi:hypothetical protein
VPAPERERGGPDLVPDRQLNLAGHGGPGDAEQTTAARLVPGVLGSLKHDRPRPGGGRGAGGGQSGRPAADDGDIPFSPFSHQKSLGELIQPTARRDSRIGAGIDREKLLKSCWRPARPALIQVRDRGRRGKRGWCNEGKASFGPLPGLARGAGSGRWRIGERRPESAGGPAWAVGAVGTKPIALASRSGAQPLSRSGRRGPRGRGGCRRRTGPGPAGRRCPPRAWQPPSR